MKKCSICNSRNSDASMFCIQCGAVLTETDSPQGGQIRPGAPAGVPSSQGDPTQAGGKSPEQPSPGGTEGFPDQAYPPYPDQAPPPPGWTQPYGQPGMYDPPGQPGFYPPPGQGYPQGYAPPQHPVGVYISPQYRQGGPATGTLPRDSQPDAGAGSSSGEGSSRIPLAQRQAPAGGFPQSYAYADIHPVIKAKKRRNAILAIVIFILLIAMCVGVFVAVGLYEKASTPDIENLQLGELVEQLNEESSMKEQIRIFTRISRLPNISADDYVAAGRNTEETIFKLGIYNLGLQRTGEPVFFKELERMASVEHIINHQDSRDNIYEIIFDKDLEDISWADVNRIKYFYQDTSSATVIYSFSSPYSYDTWEEFQEVCVEVSYRGTDRTGYRGYYALVGCEMLDTNVGIYPGDIMGKPYRYLKAFSYEDTTMSRNGTGLDTLECFQALPVIEELDIRGKYLGTGELDALSPTLKYLTARNWMPTTSGEVPLTEFSFDKLADAPGLEAVTLVQFHITGDGSRRSDIDLESLDLFSCELANTGMLESLPRLQSLVLEDCTIKELDFVVTYPNLEHLRIWGNSAVPEIYGESSLGKLKTLEIDGTVSIEHFLDNADLAYLEVGNAESLPHLGAFQNLEVLTLGGMQQVYNLGTMPELPHVEILSISPGGEDSSGNLVENVNALSLSLPSLRFLTVQNVYSAEGLHEYLMGDHLEDLVLSYMGLSASYETFAGCENLRGLTISSIRLDDEFGDEVFRGVGELHQLEYLDVSNTMISDISFLEGMSGLEIFICQKNNVVDTSILETLPNLVIADMGEEEDSPSIDPEGRVDIT